MGPEFGMIKDENEDPSSPKKKSRRAKKKMERNHTHGGTLSSSYRLKLCHMGGVRERRTIKIQKYKKPRERQKEGDTEREREREAKKEAAAIFSQFLQSLSSPTFVHLIIYEWEISPPPPPTS